MKQNRKFRFRVCVGHIYKTHTRLYAVAAYYAATSKDFVACTTKFRLFRRKLSDATFWKARKVHKLRSQRGQSRTVQTSLDRNCVCISTFKCCSNLELLSVYFEEFQERAEKVENLQIPLFRYMLRFKQYKRRSSVQCRLISS